MKILYINHYAGSQELGMEYRPYYMAREWQKRGHSVLIVAASYTHVRSKQIDIENNFEKKDIEGINYLFVKTPKYNGNGLDRIKNIITFVYKLYKYASNIVKEFNPDIVIASSTYPLDIYPASKIARIAKAKLVFEVHDLWPLSPMELGRYSKWHPFIMIMQRAENYAVRKSDMIVSILPNTKQYYIEHGMKNEKWIYIPNGVFSDEIHSDIKLPDEYENLISNLKNQEKKIVCYLGGHAISNGLDVFIDVAKKISNLNNSIAFVLIGKGDKKDELILKAMSYNLQNVYFLPPIHKRCVEQLLTKMDVLFIGFLNKKLYKYGVSPNKIFDYMKSARPIVFAINHKNNIVKEANCGISVEPENPALIADAILKLLSKSEIELRTLGENGKKYALENHNYSILAENFIKSIENIKS